MATFASLSQDVVIIILSHLDDLDSLSSSIASCRAFYNAFRCAPTSLLEAIVSREIEDDVLPEAKLAVQAAQVRARCPPDSELKSIISEMLISRESEALLKHRWTIPEAAAAINLDSVINQLVKMTLPWWLDWLRRLLQADQEKPNDSELARIKRALYRYEIYCRLLPPRTEGDGSPSPDLRAGQAAFFSHFSGYENEQLACIHEALWRLIAPGKFRLTVAPNIEAHAQPPLPAFNDIALHDIEWAASSVRYAVRLESKNTEEILSRGLEGILDIAQAETYERRYELIARDPAKPPSTSSFLCEAFLDFEVVLFKPEGFRAYTNTGVVFYKDPDRGPEAFWEWSHEGEKESPKRMRQMSTAEEERFKAMRDCGCVFWDDERIASTLLHRGPYGSVPFDTWNPIAVNRPSSFEIRVSLGVRRELFKRGFRGRCGPGNNGINGLTGMDFLRACRDGRI